MLPTQRRAVLSGADAGADDAPPLAPALLLALGLLAVGVGGAKVHIHKPGGAKLAEAAADVGGGVGGDEAIAEEEEEEGWERLSDLDDEVASLGPMHGEFCDFVPRQGTLSVDCERECVDVCIYQFHHGDAAKGYCRGLCRRPPPPSSATDAAEASGPGAAEGDDAAALASAKAAARYRARLQALAAASEARFGRRDREPAEKLPAAGGPRNSADLMDKFERLKAQHKGLKAAEGIGGDAAAGKEEDEDWEWLSDLDDEGASLGATHGEGCDFVPRQGTSSGDCQRECRDVCMYQFYNGDAAEGYCRGLCRRPPPPSSATDAAEARRSGPGAAEGDDAAALDSATAAARHRARLEAIAVASEARFGRRDRASVERLLASRGPRKVVDLMEKFERLKAQHKELEEIQRKWKCQEARPYLDHNLAFKLGLGSEACLTACSAACAQELVQAKDYCFEVCSH